MLLSPAVSNYTVAIILVVVKERCFGRLVNCFIFHKAGPVKIYEILMYRHLNIVFLN